ncbi:MAG: ribosomal protein methyltransferase [Parcubacteria group bacterium]|nr:ribosomal protein methyltransferase [Parcubacteria group bacterium]
MSAFAEWAILFLNIFMLVFGAKLIVELFRYGSVPPFIRTREPIAHEVAEAFGTLPEGSVVYDPGCGDGRVLFAIAKKNPRARYVGIELRLFPYLLAKRQRRMHPEADIRFIRGDSFKQDLSKATHVYTYLYPKVMDKLLPKLQNELRPGTVLISLDFQFKDKEAERTIPLSGAAEGKLGKLLYVYRF